MNITSIKTKGSLSQSNRLCFLCINLKIIIEIILILTHFLQDFEVKLPPSLTIFEPVVMKGSEYPVLCVGAYQLYELFIYFTCHIKNHLTGNLYASQNITTFRYSSLVFVALLCISGTLGDW